MLNEKIQLTKQLINNYKPDLYSLAQIEDRTSYNLLLADPNIFIYDEIYGQLKELFKCRNPKRKLSEQEYYELINKHIGSTPLEEYGVWAYYPWSHRLVHILGREEFIELRTNRNKYKITQQEQDFLEKKTIGIIGLSVGQSIALTIAMERICGRLRLADFDTAELSNLNRIRTGVHNIGINKTVIAAREILEIDPYLDVALFNTGITESNIDEFFTGDGKLDMLVEVCDGLDIKIVSRFKARELQIPVIMDTNDKGMLDVERFDLEPGRPILHGLAGDLDTQKIRNLTNEEKIPYILKMVGTDTLSVRLKASMMEVEQSINTWPQLASSVVLGGALVTDVGRRILLDQFHDSGRYYIDLDDLVKDQDHKEAVAKYSEADRPDELTNEELWRLADECSLQDKREELSTEQINEIVNAGILAPSGGNVQPWKFLYHKRALFVFHDEHFSYSLLDYDNLGSYVAIGAAIENISIKSAALGFAASVTYFPVLSSKKLAAAIVFERSENPDIKASLEPSITLRFTNRMVETHKQLDESAYTELSKSLSGYDGAELHFIKDREMISEVGELLAATEMLRIIHQLGHFDTFTKELRWTPEENSLKRDGIDVRTLGISNAEIAALKIAEDEQAIAFLRQLKGGDAFKKMVRKSVGGASGLGIVSMPHYSAMDFLKGGRATERVWLEATRHGISFQPISQLVFFMARMKHGNGLGLDDYFKARFNELSARFYELLPGLHEKQPVFIFRLCMAGEPGVKSMRKNIDSVLVMRN